jgi:hypothetical protein
MINENTLKTSLQDTHLEMYKKMTLNDTKIINMGTDKGDGDAGTDLVRQMFVTYKTLGA